MKVLLKVLSGPDSGKQFSSAQSDTVTVGRGQACQVQLTDPSVSRTHFDISYKDGHFLLTDLGSATGVLVNGGKADEKRLRHGDRIQVGKTEISVELVGDPEDDTYVSSARNG